MAKDPEKERLRGISRRAYFREYRKKHPQQYIGHGTSIGYRGEELALKVLIGSKKINRPCDLSWNRKLVDVKTAKPTMTNRGTYRWKFFLMKQKDTTDLYLLIRKDNDDRVIDIHLIPNFGKSNLSFNENTVIKYSKYLLSL
jgi:hypothetical protein